jgi:hypothetical protein
MSDEIQPPSPEPVPPSWHRVHLWQIQAVRDALVVLLVIGVIWLGDVLSIITVPLLVALLLAYLVEPLVAWLARLVPRLGRKGAVVAMVGLLALVGSGVLLGTVPVLVRQGAALVHNADRYAANLKRFATSSDLPAWLRERLAPVVAYLPDGAPARSATRTTHPRRRSPLRTSPRQRSPRRRPRRLRPRQRPPCPAPRFRSMSNACAS